MLSRRPAVVLWAAVVALASILLVGEVAAQPKAAASATATSSSTTDTPEPSSEAPPRPKRPAMPRVLPYDQGTPRQSVQGFLAAVEAGRLDDAARYLDLRGMRWGERTPAETAELIAEVLRRRVWIDPSTISGSAEGDPTDGADSERIATVEVAGDEIDITLARVDHSGEKVWLISASTVARAGDLSDALGTHSWAMRFVPDALEDQRWLALWAWQWIGLAVAVVVAFPFGWLLASALLLLLSRFAERTQVLWDDAMVRGIAGPARFGVGWATMLIVARTLRLPTQLADNARPWLVIPLVVATGWVLIKAIRSVTNVYLLKVPDDEELNTRGLRTQLVILRKIGSVTVGLIAFGVALMQFEVVRSVGWSLLASAGVAGVALGFAAQKSLGAVIAGLQLSVTQPLRLGDAIIVNGEWGEVEEITLTYVRVKLWDERRMVVPVEKFLSETFENWSKPGDAMIGVVFVSVDPTAPVAKIRAELERLAEEHPDHDGRECLLQVTDADERRMLLRCRVSTSDITRAFPMRCDLREGLVDFLQQLEGGRYLPRQRWEQVG